MTAKQIQRLRESLGLTKEQFAKEIGATLNTVVRWERVGPKGSSRPSPAYVEKLERLESETKQLEKK